MVQQQRRIPEPDPPRRSQKPNRRRPRATLAAWVAVAIAAVEVVARILER